MVIEVVSRKTKLQKLYEIPMLYDIAFRRNAVSYHVDGLIECHQRFRKEHHLERIIEFASGPSRHALEFARRNYKAAALDYASDMCQYAAGLAKQLEVQLDVYQGNMRDFTIPNKYDLAMTLLNSIGHLYTAADLEKHLFSVWRHLNVDGLYVIEAHYPHWTTQESLQAASWTVEMRELRLRVDFGTPEDEFDPEMRIRKLFVHIHGQWRGEPIDFNDYLTIRSWSGEALEAVIHESQAFEIVRKLGALDSNTKFNPDESQRLVYLLRRLE
jgi:SAM-dependent methyltransferase